MEAPTFTPRRSLAANTVWNVLGQGVPLVAAVLAIPALLHSLGTDRFGLLSLAWVLVGYFSIFDLGIGRALTQVIASSVEAAEPVRLNRLVWTSLALLTVIGIAVGAIIATVSPWTISQVLKTPAYLAPEATRAALLVAVAVPFGVTATGLRGILEARQAFFASNAVRLPLGVATYLAPLAVLPFSNHIDAACAALLASRIFALAGFAIACLRVTPDLFHDPGLARAGIGRLLAFSGWMAVTNIVAPFMTYLDRFVIGSFISIAAIAYYATPFDLVTRLLIIPAGITGVMFPAFASLYPLGVDETRRLFLRGVKYLALLMFPVTLLFVTLAKPGLEVWLGQSFAERSTSVLQWLAVGVLLNSLGQAAFVLVQGSGRPRLTGLLNLAELPVYLVGLVAFISAWGITGAAVAWTVRTALDSAILFFIAARLLHVSRPMVSPASGLIATVAVLLLTAGALPMTLLEKLAFLVIVAAIAVPLTWSRLLTASERSRLAQALPHAKPS